MTSVAGIMCTWNESRMAPLAIESIQDFVDELIVVDNDSTDGTREVIKETADRFHLDTVIYNKPDLRLRHARLFAIKQTDCDWLLICDGDEVFHTDGPNSIENLREYMDTPNQLVRSPMRYLYLDLEHTHLNRVELPPHKTLYPNDETIEQMPEQRDLPAYSGGSVSLDYPMKFNCGVKDHERIYLREKVWYEWSKEVETDLSIREYAKQKFDLDTLDEMVANFIESRKESPNVVEYDPDEYGYIPEVIRNYINDGQIRGYNS